MQFKIRGDLRKEAHRAPKRNSSAQKDGLGNSRVGQGRETYLTDNSIKSPLNHYALLVYSKVKYHTKQFMHFKVKASMFSPS